MGVVLHPGFQLLDVAGPTAAFEIAERFSPGSYDVRLLAPGGGSMESSSGITLSTRPLRHGSLDTIIVSGGEIVRAVDASAEIVRFLKRATARRIASVCSGAFLLAEAGWLDGKRATTHWESTERFRARYPQVTLDSDRIFVRDGKVWTSAGITAGIDLALALVEDDLGSEIARRTARQLVVHQRRPGGQSQFSDLTERSGRTGRFTSLIAWIGEHVSESLTVERLAHRAAMSPRHFARTFAAETGTTPAKVVERLRLETARTAVEGSDASFEQIARDAGFGDAGRMRRAFLRSLGLPPQALRRSARA